MPRLIVIRGVDEGKQFELTGGVTVGRHSANAVPLHDTQVSRRHLEVRAVPTGYELHDLGRPFDFRLNQRRGHSDPFQVGLASGISELAMIRFVITVIICHRHHTSRRSSRPA